MFSPKIHHTFSFKEIDGKLTKYCFQDLTENYYDRAVEFMIKNQVKEETFHKSLNLCENPNAVRAIRSFYQDVFKEKTSLVCFKNGSNEIISVNALFVKTKNYKEDNTVRFYEDYIEKPFFLI